jgi:hypothetical protein
MFYNNIIPLGDNCAISQILKELNLRKKAYPFDWCSHVGPLPSYSIIESNINLFMELLESGNIINIKNKMLGNNIIKNNKINEEYIFPHENDTEDNINTKYIRRIQRLYDDTINKYNKNLFILITRGYLLKEDILINLYNKLISYNPYNKIIFISGVEHNYLNNLKLPNLLYKYIYYDLNQCWIPDNSIFRPQIKKYLNKHFNI